MDEEYREGLDGMIESLKKLSEELTELEKVLVSISSEDNKQSKCSKRRPVKK